MTSRINHYSTNTAIRWLRVRDLNDGWLTINANAVSCIKPAGYGLSLHMLCGSIILLTPKEAIRVMKHLVAIGVKV